MGNAAVNEQTLNSWKMDAVRSEARKALGGGSWVVRASKAQLISWIVRGFGPTDEERRALTHAPIGVHETPPGRDAQPTGEAELIARSIQDAVIEALSANVRLWAAAPDLLGHLRQVVACLSGDEKWWEEEGVHRHEGTGKSSEEIRQDVLEEARAAIAKATEGRA